MLIRSTFAEVLGTYYQLRRLCSGPRQNLLSHERVNFLSAAATKEGVQHIIGCFNFVRDFCPALFAIADKPLFTLAAKGKGRTKVDWGPEHDDALSQMKAMVDGSMLITPDPKRRLHVRTDASRLGIGCVLFQCSDNGTPQAICYAGKAFDSTQQDYSTVEQEPMLWCTLASALKILPKDTLSLW